jgi:hypothetical protein
MARTRQTVSIDGKITKAQDAVVRAKAKYDAAVTELERLMAKREEMKKAELMAAFMSSKKSYEEVIRYLKS